ncbi:hypothetical protein DSO57_1022180 [Entomophthora muscae]|uniref:Uncharacterized protein n=1 Tax=Entomophthora muscae TaxID=34485 RepID=A0ACC2TQT2_9FUNG|nr:hypothetical protein DSO57_1022180 [Entomophthora muscae]
MEMTNRGSEFIGGEFARLLQDWYWPTEGLAPAEVQVYGGDACLVIGKVLEEFALMKAKYKLLTNHSPLLENNNSSKLVPGYNPGHTLGTDDQEPHNLSAKNASSHSGVQTRVDFPLAGYKAAAISDKCGVNYFKNVQVPKKLWSWDTIIGVGYSLTAAYLSEAIIWQSSKIILPKN